MCVFVGFEPEGGFMTTIEWCDETWNPVWGCKNKCYYCYAERKIYPQSKWVKTKKFNEPWWIESNYSKKFPKKTKRVFVNSMSDIMYWEAEWMERVLDRIATMPEIDFIFLTKGGFEVYAKYDFPINCILGVTATSMMDLARLRMLSESMTLASTCPKLLNIEPILTQINLSDNPKEAAFISRFDWVIIGAETGSGITTIPKLGWYQELMDCCINMNVPYFIKPSLKRITPTEFYAQNHIKGELE